MTDSRINFSYLIFLSFANVALFIRSIYFLVSLSMFLKLANILESTEVQIKLNFFSDKIIYKE